jgi:MFS family permease
MADSGPDKKLFWGCFLALITTAFAFVSRLFLLGEWQKEFGLTDVQTGELAGMGIWPFAISIIAFSLFIDKIGYKTAMVISFLGYVIWSIMAVAAFFVSDGGQGDAAMGYKLIYWGSLILGLSNGTVEAYINPVVATMFKSNKTKWLNILHAGWPGGLAICGLITIALSFYAVPWWIRIAIIIPPAIIFFFMLIGRDFPAQERVASGVSYREMLAEFGVLGAAIAMFLIVLQLNGTFPTEKYPIPLLSNYLPNEWLFAIVGAIATLGFGAYTQALGNKLLFFMALIMVPLATTEIGTDGWIEEIMKSIAATNGFDAGLVLVYTSVIMMVLRFFAGPIVHAISPIGLLIGSSVLAIVGLYWLSFASGMVIFAAAAVYAFGKTFFWPTMLGVAGEQTPKGGALTLNALGGIGMLGVGVLGFPYIGSLQSQTAVTAVSADAELAEMVPSAFDDGKLKAVADDKLFSMIPYKKVDDDSMKAAIGKLPATEQEKVNSRLTEVTEGSKQSALASMCIFPIIMLVGYIALGIYFKSRGGYEVKTLDGKTH